MCSFSRVTKLPPPDNGSDSGLHKKCAFCSSTLHLDWSIDSLVGDVGGDNVDCLWRYRSWGSEVDSPASSSRFSILRCCWQLYSDPLLHALFARLPDPSIGTLEIFPGHFHCCCRCCYSKQNQSDHRWTDADRSQRLPGNCACWLCTRPARRSGISWTLVPV